MTQGDGEARHGDWNIQGQPFHYLEWGPADGEPVLCLHGFPDVPRTYDALAKGLAARGYRVVAPWMRGYAPSTLRGPFTLEQLAQDVLAFADRVSPRGPLHLVGHDWGAAAAYAALAAAPSRFRSAATYAVPHPMAFAEMLVKDPAQVRRSWYMGLFQIPKVSEKILARGGYHFVDQIWKAWSPHYHVSRAYLDEVKSCLAASMPAPLRYYRSILWPPQLAVPRFRHAVREHQRIRVPTLYIHGRNDACVGVPPPGMHEKWFVAEAKVLVFDGAGHFVHHEKADEVIAETAAWFARTDWDHIKVSGAWEQQLHS